MKKKENYIFSCVNKDKVDSISKIPKKKVHFSKRNKIRKNRVRKSIRSYTTYMKSKLWVARKNRYWQEHGRFCVACGGTYRVTLHHAYYSGIYGYEPDTEVFALCGGCHQEFHDTYPLQKDMREDTNKFIDDKQSDLYLKGGY